MRSLTASVALVAATLLLAALAAPAAASLLQPPRPPMGLRRGAGRHQRRDAESIKSLRQQALSGQHRGSSEARDAAASASGLQMHQLWRLNLTTPEFLQITTLQPSTVEPDTMLAYAAAVEGVNASVAYLLALNATTGDRLWTATFSTYAPDGCSPMIETATTVACVGLTKYAVANRTTGAVVVEAAFPAGFEQWNGDYWTVSTGNYSATHGHLLAMTLINANLTIVKAVLLDGITGAVTDLGNASAGGRRLMGVFGGALRETAKNGAGFAWTATLTAMNATAGGPTCNSAFTATFSTTGVATVVELPSSFTNSAHVSAADCQQAYVSANPDDDVVLATHLGAEGVISAYFASNATFRYAIAIPYRALPGRLPTMIRPVTLTVQGGQRVEGVYVQDACSLAAVDVYNMSKWVYSDCSIAMLPLLAMDAKTVTLGSLKYGQVARFSLADGFGLWDSKVPQGRGRFATQATADLLVMLRFPASEVTFVRATDGKLLGTLDVLVPLWDDFANVAYFHPTPGATAGTGTLYIGGLTAGTILTMSVAPKTA